LRKIERNAPRDHEGGRGQHNGQQHQHHIDQRHDVDGFDVLVHAQPPWASSNSASLTRTTRRSALFSPTQGMATPMPTAVALSARARPTMMVFTSMAPLLPRASKVSMMPSTVPSRPMYGALAATEPITWRRLVSSVSSRTRLL